MKAYRYILPALVLLSAMSCYKDKGNYDYTDLMEPVIDIPMISARGMEITYPRYETLTLDPTVTVDGQDASANYDYEWKMYTLSPTLNTSERPYVYEPQPVILGTERRQEVYLDDEPGNYHIVLKATHKQTEAITYFKIQLTIGSLTGWLVVENDANAKGDLSIIRDMELCPELLSEEQAGTSHGIFSRFNDGAKLERAKFAHWQWATSTPASQRLYIFTDQLLDKNDIGATPGAYVLNSGTFELTADGTDWRNVFDPANIPQTLNMQAAHFESPMRASATLFINDGNIYGNYWMSNSKPIGPAKIDGATLKVHPYIAWIPRYNVTGNDVRAVLYDNTNYPKGSFVVSDIFVNSSGSWSRPAVSGGAFDPTNISADGTDMQLRHLGTGSDGTTCAIFVDEIAGTPWLLHGDFRVAASPAVLGKYDLSTLPGIADASCYEFCFRGDVIFWAGENTVRSYGFPGGTVHTLLNIPAGETIHQMKIYNNPDNPQFTGRILFVSTNSPSGGKVYKIKFNELNGALNQVETFTGFGTIVDMTQKNN